MARENAKQILWENVKVFGKEGLYSDYRIDRSTIPEGTYLYEVRYSDEGWCDPVEIGLGIMVNFLGTILMKEPLELIPVLNEKNAYLDIDPDKDFIFLGGNVKLE